jgi:indole-3-glycerol phosphate synthase
MSVLDRIFAHKHDEVAAAKLQTPLAELKAKVQDLPATQGFFQAIATSPTLALIAEIKKASPSQGLIRDPFDPVEIARAYETAEATCLSVLTDVSFFQGSPANIALARAATKLPILRKDFIDDPYQVYEARVWGADAILLILASLDDSLVAELAQLSGELHLDVLAEVHDEAEAERAVALNLPLVGINNRDLRTFKTDLTVTQRIAPILANHAIVVSESALETRADVLQVADWGAKAVLIGTTFCRAPVIEDKVHELMRDPR